MPFVTCAANGCTSKARGANTAWSDSLTLRGTYSMSSSGAKHRGHTDSFSQTQASFKRALTRRLLRHLL